MFKPQKALHLHLELDKKTTTVGEDTFIIMQKYDGWYGSKRVAVSKPLATSMPPSPILSSRGREIPALSDLSALLSMHEADLQMHDYEFNGTLIFEIMISGMPVFKDLNGVLNRSKAPCQAEGAYIMCHDFVPEFVSSLSALQRFSIVRTYVRLMNLPYVRLAEVLTTGTIEDMQTCAELMWAQGKEGVIGKLLSSPYEQGKRNKSLIKIKEELTLDLLVVDYELGKGKYSKLIGKLIVEQKDGMRHAVSGMTDDERVAWTNDFSLIMGCVVEVKAMKILPNGSLREPRFKAVRYDKSKSDID